MVKPLGDSCLGKPVLPSGYAEQLLALTIFIRSSSGEKESSPAWLMAAKKFKLQNQQPLQPRSLQGLSELCTAREVFSGSAPLTREACTHGGLAQPPIDLNMGWNLLWSSHVNALKQRLGDEPAAVLWFDMPGASTAAGTKEELRLADVIGPWARYCYR